MILRVFNKEQVKELNIIKFRGKHTQLEREIHDSISTVKLSIFSLDLNINSIIAALVLSLTAQEEEQNKELLYASLDQLSTIFLHTIMIIINFFLDL